MNEKDAIMADLWEQHCEEMKTMEGNYCTINGKQCLFEFVPSADQAWQTWATNEVSQAAMYPSPYANVSTSTMSCVNGSIGTSDSCTWKVWSAQQREKHGKTSLLRCLVMKLCPLEVRNILLIQMKPKMTIN